MYTISLYMCLYLCIYFIYVHIHYVYVYICMSGLETIMFFYIQCMAYVCTKVHTKYMLSMTQNMCILYSLLCLSYLSVYCKKY